MSEGRSVVTQLVQETRRYGGVRATETEASVGCRSGSAAYSKSMQTVVIKLCNLNACMHEILNSLYSRVFSHVRLATHRTVKRKEGLAADMRLQLPRLFITHCVVQNSYRNYNYDNSIIQHSFENLTTQKNATIF